MSKEKKLLFKTRAAWRKWLKKNHLSVQRIWLIYFKKNSGKISVSYNDAVEEALCFGWIDGQVKSIDTESFMQRFTPRRPRSQWSVSNIKRVKKLIAQGLMNTHGLKAYKEGIKESDPIPSSKTFIVPTAFKKQLGKNKKAFKNFESLSPSSKMMYVYWIKSSKREETRQRRMDKMMEFLESGANPLTKMPASPKRKQKIKT